MEVVASRGFEVACPEASTESIRPNESAFHQACTVALDREDEGRIHALWIASRASDANDVGRVVLRVPNVNAQPAVQTIELRRAFPEPAESISLREGWYVGTAKLVGSTFPATDTIDEGPPAAPEGPIRVWLDTGDPGPNGSLPPTFAGAHLVIEDQTLIMSSGGFVGARLNFASPSAGYSWATPGTSAPSWLLGSDASDVWVQPSIASVFENFPTAHPFEDLLPTSTFIAPVNSSDDVSALVPISTKVRDSDTGSQWWHLTLRRASDQGPPPSFVIPAHPCPDFCLEGGTLWNPGSSFSAWMNRLIEVMDVRAIGRTDWEENRIDDRGVLTCMSSTPLIRVAALPVSTSRMVRRCQASPSTVPSALCVTFAASLQSTARNLGSHPWSSSEDAKVNRMVSDRFEICRADLLENDPGGCQCAAEQRLLDEDDVLRFCAGGAVCGEEEEPTYGINACPIDPYVTYFDPARPDEMNPLDQAEYLHATSCANRVASFGADTIEYGIPDSPVAPSDPDFAAAVLKRSGFRLSTIASVSQGDLLYENDGAPLTLDAHWFPTPAVDGGNRPGLTFPFFIEPELVAVNADIQTRRKMLETCAADLDRLPPELPSWTPATRPTSLVDRLTTFFSSKGCVDLGRFTVEIEWLLRAAELEVSWVGAGINSPDGDSPHSPHEIASKLVMRRLDQWLTVQSFVSSQSAESDPLDQILQADDETGNVRRDEALSIDASMDRAMRGWAMVLHPRVTQLLATMPGEWLASPDYRGLLREDPLYEDLAGSDHGMTQGLAIGILDFAQGTLALIERHLELQEPWLYEECLAKGHTVRDRVIERVSALIRAITLAGETAATTVARATVSGIRPTWAKSYERVRRELAPRLTRVTAKLRDVIECKNPLGIDATTLPLYFVDPQGVNQRFFASSDYLLSQWAIPAVASAASGFQRARSAWLFQRDANIRQVQREIDHEKREIAIKEEYGRRLRDACGLSISSIEAFDKYHRGELGLDSCFLTPGSEIPECATPQERLWAESTSSYALGAQRECPNWASMGFEVWDAKERLCRMGREWSQFVTGNSPSNNAFVFWWQIFMNSARIDRWDVGDDSPLSQFDDLKSLVLWVAPENVSTMSDSRRSIIEAFATSDTPPNGIREVLSMSAEECGKYLRVNGAYTYSIEQIKRLESVMWSSLGYKDGPNSCSSDACKRMGGSFFAASETKHGPACRAYMEQEMALDGSIDTNTLAKEVLPPEVIGSCYRGTLGQHLLAVFRAYGLLRQSRLAFDDALREYETTAWRCSRRVESGDALLAANQATHDLIKEAQEASDWLSILGAALPGIKTIVAIAAGAATFGVGTAFAVAASVTNVAQGVVAQDARDEIADIRFRHEQLVQSLSTASTFNECKADLSRIVDRFESHIQAAKTASLDAGAAILALGNEIRSLSADMEQGTAALEREEDADQLLPDLRHDYWLSEEVSAFQADFAWAKRLAYLALMAMEYETQASIPVHAAVIGARHPRELEDAIRDLQREQGTRSINGNRPEERTVVYSLRDDLLRIPWTFSSPQGEFRRTKPQGFAAVLLDDTNRLYGADGEYLGQGIPFDVLPDGPQEYRCAERMWSVNASIIGDILGVRTPELPLFVLKQNTFESQWCRGRGDGNARQVQTLKPSLNLFKDGSGRGSDDEASAWSWAYVDAWLNVPRKEFHREAYSDGSSEELAGRGLYGRYILLFPYKGLLEEGFDLSALEDVAIRFDYLSVSNGSPTAGGLSGSTSPKDDYTTDFSRVRATAMASYASVAWRDPDFPTLDKVVVVRRAGELPIGVDDPDAESWVIDRGVESFEDPAAWAGSTWYYALYAVDLNGQIYGGQSASVTPQFVPVEDLTCTSDDAAVLLDWTCSCPRQTDHAACLISLAWRNSVGERMPSALWG